jgi:hypothetical protein
MADTLMVWGLAFIVWMIGIIALARSYTMTFGAWLGVIAIIGSMLAVFWTAAGAFGPVVWFIFLVVAWVVIGGGMFVLIRRTRP